MQFESRVKRNVFINIIIESIPDILLVAAIVYFMQGGWLGFIFGYIALQLAFIVIWVVRSLWGWLVFTIIGKKAIVDQYYEYLLSNNLPNPTDYADSPERYFAEVASNKDLDPEIRIKAAGVCGEFGMIRSFGMLQRLMSLSMSMEDALEKYRLHILESKK